MKSKEVDKWLSWYKFWRRSWGRIRSISKNVIALIDEGNTIPFIARYRKELHGAMDDTTLRTLAERLSYLRNLDAAATGRCQKGH